MGLKFFMLVVSKFFFLNQILIYNSKSQFLSIYSFACQVRRVKLFLFMPVPPFPVSFNDLFAKVGHRGSKLTSSLKDIVHGDVKCENVLIFEKENEISKQSEIYEPQLRPSAYAI